MGQDKTDVHLRGHGQPAAAVTADRSLRFHYGNKSIEETLDGTDLGGTWKDLADAVRTNDTGDFDSACDDLKAMVSFDWDDDATDWRNATWKAFSDVIHPA